MRGRISQLLPVLALHAQPCSSLRKWWPAAFLTSWRPICHTVGASRHAPVVFEPRTRRPAALTGRLVDEQPTTDSWRASWRSPLRFSAIFLGMVVFLLF